MASREELHTEISLASLGRDLTSLGGRQELPVVQPRWPLLDSLTRLVAAGEHVLLVGMSGAGKTALVESLAQSIVGGDTGTPGPLADRRIVECAVSAFQRDCLYVHEFETRVHHIIGRCQERRAILVLDHVDEAVGAGACEGKEERTLANLLMPYLADRQITVVGTTNPDGLRIMLRHNQAFVNRFSVLDVPPMSCAETLGLARDLSKTHGDRYGVMLTRSALAEAIELGERFYPWRVLPGKAVDLVREALALAAAVPRAAGSPADGAAVRAKARLTAARLREVFCQQRGLPLWLVDASRPIHRADLVAQMEDELYGQTAAVEIVVDALLAFKADLNDRRRPIAAFLLLGPTGVGKTQLAKTTARLLFGSEDRLLRYDMADYSSWDALPALAGTARTRRARGLVPEVLAQPFTVILLDEIEKAHHHAQAVLLPLLGEGRLTDETGRTADFANTVIFMTSNVGADLYGRSTVGFSAGAEERSVTDRDLRERVARVFLPEFLNRLTRIITCPPLSRADVLRIARREVQDIARRPGLQRHGLRLDLDPSVFEILAERGFSAEYGARQMKRAVEELMVGPLAELICAGGLPPGQTLRVAASRGRLVFEPAHRYAIQARQRITG